MRGPSVPPATALVNAVWGLDTLRAQNDVLRGLQRRITAAESVEPLALDEPPSRKEMGLWVGLMDGLEGALLENERLRSELAAYIAPGKVAGS